MIVVFEYMQVDEPMILCSNKCMHVQCFHFSEVEE